MQLDILTLFPEMMEPLKHSILGRARSAGRFSLKIHQIRDHGLGRHKVVDDTPYGGGSGMVMRVDVVAAALANVRQEHSHIVLLDPAGTPFNQAKARQLATLSHLVLICGHYEGIDDRVRQHLIHEAISIGDYVLTGGELAAMVIADATLRLLPGVLGNAHSSEEESFSAGLLEYPQYTRPHTWENHPIPEILLSGHHANIARWRQEQAVVRTEQVRPELLKKA
jgi:tRNA (guanine37-N1)-methyltransferase